MDESLDNDFSDTQLIDAVLTFFSVFNAQGRLKALEVTSY